MSYDPTCKKWRRRYETNVMAEHSGIDQGSALRVASVEYEVQATREDWLQVRADRRRGVNLFLLEEYAALRIRGELMEEQRIFGQTHGCPDSIGSDNPLSAGWRRTCERGALRRIERDNLDNLPWSPHRPTPQQPWARNLPVGRSSRYAFDNYQDKEVRIKAIGPWECIE